MEHREPGWRGAAKLSSGTATAGKKKRRFSVLDKMFFLLAAERLNKAAEQTRKLEYLVQTTNKTLEKCNFH